MGSQKYNCQVFLKILELLLSIKDNLAMFSISDCHFSLFVLFAHSRSRPWMPLSTLYHIKADWPEMSVEFRQRNPTLKLLVEAGERAQWLKHPLHNSKDLSSDSQNPCKVRCSSLHLQSQPSTVRWRQENLWKLLGQLALQMQHQMTRDPASNKLKSGLILIMIYIYIMYNNGKIIHMKYMYIIIIDTYIYRLNLIFFYSYTLYK